MYNQPDQKDRRRAWVLLSASLPDDAAGSIYNELGEAGGDNYVIVRADVLTSTFNGSNIVVPVDAAPDQFNATVEKLEDIDGVEVIAVLEVSNHYPPATYKAHGYTTSFQFAKDMKWSPPEKEGRYPNSPGDNPWG